jgi:hypothetical protein
MYGRAGPELLRARMLSLNNNHHPHKVRRGPFMPNLTETAAFSFLTAKRHSFISKVEESSELRRQAAYAAEDWHDALMHDVFH